MAGNGTITSANAVFMLAVAGLFVTPQQLKGFSADDVFDAEALDKAEVVMGVDGKLSAGFIYKEVKHGVTLQADSASNDIFEQWVRAQDSQGDLFFASGTIVQPAIGKSYTLNRGVLMTYPVFADAKKTLQPRKYGLVWESVQAAPI